MSHLEVIERLYTALKLMRFQASLPVSEIDSDFFWRVSKHFHTTLNLYYYDIKKLSDQDYGDLLRLHNEVKDHFEAVHREKYAFRRPLFVSRAYREADKDSQGYPLHPLQLRDLLEQEVFKFLLIFGRVSVPQQTTPTAAT